ncbi:hypothetical protein I4U23_006145 [Adineta vaga]|nr:hypothetical protein I4U23_006145 [Adineta vaga]
MYKVTNKHISQIIPLKDDRNQLTFETMKNIVRMTLKQDSLDEFLFVYHGYQITNDEIFQETKYPILTLINHPFERELNEISSSIIHLQVYELLIRISIYSILFTQRNLSNLERFFNYCDQNKSFSFEIRELEIALLTLIELFNQQMTNNNWSHLNYYDLIIPLSNEQNLNYYQSILLFGDILFEYVRTTQLPLLINQNDSDEIIQNNLNDFMPKFLECLDKTLNISIVINPKQTEIQTATILCQNTLTYLGKILFSPILIIGTIFQCLNQIYGKIRKNKFIDKEISFDLIVNFCSIILILSIFNVIIYYSHNISSIDVNQMEIYWPLLLIISILIILHVYQTSSFHRRTFFNRNLLKNTYHTAHLQLLEIKSTPNNTKLSTYSIDYQSKSHFYEIIDRKMNDFHPTLLHKSITESLINSSQNPTSNLFYCIVSILLLISFLPLVIIHPFIPTLYRIFHLNIIFTNIPWDIRLIQYSYIIFSFMFYTSIISLMIKSISNYLSILYDLRILLSSTDLKKQVDFECEFYLNLRRSENLEYFVQLFQQIIRNIDKNHVLITTMTCVLLIDIILILTAIIRVFVYGRSTDLLTIWCLIDIVILSFFIMLFIIVVVLINKSINYDFIRHLRNLKKDITTSNIIHEKDNINYDYLDIIIEHMESVSDQYSVKLLGFVVDHSLAIKIFISIVTGIASAIASLVQQ